MGPPLKTRPRSARRLAKDITDEYHGIIIQESLVDRSVLRNVRILGHEKGGEWTLLRVGVTSRGIATTIHRIQPRLRIVDEVPFYAHFYRRDELIVVFPRRTFRLTPERATWGPAVRYGRSVGISEDELDFKPCRFEDETY